MPPIRNRRSSRAKEKAATAKAAVEVQKHTDQTELTVAEAQSLYATVKRKFSATVNESAVGFYRRMKSSIRVDWIA